MNKEKVLGSMLGIIGLITPQMLFIYTGSKDNITIWILPGFFYVMGYFGYVGVNAEMFPSEWGIDYLNLIWYTNPSQIPTRRSLLESFSVDFYIKAFSTFLYGGNSSRTSMDISGILFITSGLLSIVAVISVLVLKNARMSGILFIVAGILSIIVMVLTWQTALPWSSWARFISNTGLFINIDFFPFPLGASFLIAGGFVNFRQN